MLVLRTGNPAGFHSRHLIRNCFTPGIQGEFNLYPNRTKTQKEWQSYWLDSNEMFVWEMWFVLLSLKGASI